MKSKSTFKKVEVNQIQMNKKNIFKEEEVDYNKVIFNEVEDEVVY